ncbi:MAG: transporter substrate-binding domain-containing protein, partial [Carnobacterium jeotgali]
ADNPGYRLAGGNFTQEPYGIAINKGQDDFLIKVNEALNKLKSNGVYDEIYAKWIPEME